MTERWDVPLGVLRGYASESFAYSMAEGIRAALNRGKTVHVYELGDHDPSGVGAWRDLQSKVTRFLAEGEVGDVFAAMLYALIGDDTAGNPKAGSVHFERLAVTEGQIVDLGLPTRPTKKSDSRAKSFTGGSVEVDAIPADILRELVDDAIVRHIDPEQLRLTRVYEQSERDIFARMRGAS